MNANFKIQKSVKKIQWFDELTLSDLPNVGGKNASLGELYQQLTKQGIKVPNGFAITTAVYKDFLQHNNTIPDVKAALNELDIKDFSNLRQVGAKARAVILRHQFSYPAQIAILSAYQMLLDSEGENISLAVRSSATAEGLPHARFVGQQESYLNIKGEDALLEACLYCYASLFTDRAIKYRIDQGLKHEEVAISIGVQRMVRSDKASSGVLFTINPESGFQDTVVINSAWGLGELVVKGKVDPDEFIVYKPNIDTSKKAILSSKVGAKQETLIYNESNQNPLISSTLLTATPLELQKQITLTSEEIKTLARWAVLIEKHYQCPMDIEWAKDGITEELFIVQARPKTVCTSQKNQFFKLLRFLLALPQKMQKG